MKINIKKLGVRLIVQQCCLFFTFKVTSQNNIQNLKVYFSLEGIVSFIIHTVNENISTI